MLLWCKESGWKTRLTRVSIESSYRIIWGLFKTYQENGNRDLKYFSARCFCDKVFDFELTWARLRMSYCDPLPSVVRSSTPLNDFSKTPLPVFFKRHLRLSVKGGLKIYTNGHGPLKKMAACPYMVKTTKKAFGLNLGIQHRELKVYQVCSNDDRLLLWNRLSKIHQISYGAFCRNSTDIFFEWFQATEQDSCHAHVWWKHLKIFFSRTKKALRLNLGIKHRRLKVYRICSNKGRILTFDLFTARSNLRPHTFVWEKSWRLILSKCI